MNFEVFHTFYCDSTSPRGAQNRGIFDDIFSLEYNDWRELYITKYVQYDIYKGVIIWLSRFRIWIELELRFSFRQKVSFATKMPRHIEIANNQIMTVLEMKFPFKWAINELKRRSIKARKLVQTFFPQKKFMEGTSYTCLGFSDT